MRAAWPAHFPVATRSAWLALLSGLWGLAAASLMAWCGWHAQLGRVSLAPAALGGLLVALWLSRWLPARSAKDLADHLRWDGCAWCLLGSNPEPGHPQLIMDGGAWMLLRWRGQGARSRVRWLPFSAVDDPAAWHAFRVAVVDASRRPVSDITVGTRS
jgi:hypothetical protein